MDSTDGGRSRSGAAAVEARVAALCGPVAAEGRQQGLEGMSVSRCVQRRLSGVVFASNHAARRLDELQENLGQGPGPTALLLRGPVLVPDLQRDESAAGWGELRREATDLGVGSVFAFPVQIGAVALGLLTTHGGGPVRLEDTTLRSLVGLADTLTGAFLPPADGYRDGRDPESDLLDSGRIVTHQAVGMLSVQLECSLEDAMVALRARAYAEGASVATVARDVVERRIRFAPGVGTGVPEDDDESGQEGGPSHG
jgi:hypothetical protein